MTLAKYSRPNSKKSNCLKDVLNNPKLKRFFLKQTSVLLRQIIQESAKNIELQLNCIAKKLIVAERIAGLAVLSNYSIKRAVSFKEHLYLVGLALELESNYIFSKKYVKHGKLTTVIFKTQHYDKYNECDKKC